MKITCAKYTTFTVRILPIIKIFTVILLIHPKYGINREVTIILINEYFLILVKAGLRLIPYSGYINWDYHDEHA